MAVTVKDLSIKTWWRSLVTYISLAGATCDALCSLGVGGGRFPGSREGRLEALKITQSVRIGSSTIGREAERRSPQSIGLGKSVAWWKEERKEAAAAAAARATRTRTWGGGGQWLANPPPMPMPQRLAPISSVQ